MVGRANDFRLISCDRPVSERSRTAAGRRPTAGGRRHPPLSAPVRASRAGRQADPAASDGMSSATPRPVALITGVGRRVGIGAAIATRLARDGWDVGTTGWAPYDDRMPWGRDLTADRRAELTAEPTGSIARAIRAEGARTVTIAADLEDVTARGADLRRHRGGAGSGDRAGAVPLRVGGLVAAGHDRGELRPAHGRQRQGVLAADRRARPAVPRRRRRRPDRRADQRSHRRQPALRGQPGVTGPAGQCEGWASARPVSDSNTCALEASIATVTASPIRTSVRPGILATTRCPSIWIVTNASRPLRSTDRTVPDSVARSGSMSPEAIRTSSAAAPARRHGRRGRPAPAERAPTSAACVGRPDSPVIPAEATTRAGS